jgi:hypothetical protein
MTSQINFNIIDGTYPIAGQDNSSQGFRDNFTNIKNNFESAYQEITDLQNKALLASPLTNGIFNNNLQGNPITDAEMQGMREKYFNIGNTVSGAINVDFNVGTFQTMTLTGSATISAFTSFSSTDGSFAKVGLQITTANSAYTVTMPTSVTRAYDIAGYNPSTRVLTFDGPGTYTYEIGTVDGGTSFYLLDLSGNKTRVMGGNLVITTAVGGVSTTGITMTVTNIGGIAIGNITANNFIGNTIISGGEDASFTGNVTADWFIANSAYVGQLATNTQPNITLVGTLTSLSVSGNANVGNLTVNGFTDLCGGDAYGVELVSATNGGSTTLSNAAGFALVNPVSSTISTYTVIMPSNPMPGQLIRISFANTITTLTHSGSGSDAVYGNLNAIEVNSNIGGSWIYYMTSEINSGNGVWYRIG